MSALVICVQTIFYDFRQFSRKGTWVLLLRALHQEERCRLGKDPHPSVAIVDAQSVKTVEESAHISGFDAHKRVKGRKRHLLVDTLGIPMSKRITVFTAPLVTLAVTSLGRQSATLGEDDAKTGCHPSKAR
jgi:putative transposase